MGVIKKKTAVRGTEGGVKYICDVCSADITSTVRIRCAHEICREYDLCVPCFSQGSSSRDHDPPTHPYSVIEQHSVPIFTDEWGADEEALLLEGAETYGLGSWADIADHIGGFREKDEVRDHYVETYINSSKFPLPERASPSDRSLIEDWPREEFLARKKRRIEERKEARLNLSPTQPKHKPNASTPACHEVAGFMPGRLEFETEYYNEAEESVQHMQFDPGEGELPDKNGKYDEEVNLKMTVMEIYNSRLTSRVERKKIIFEHQLLEYRRNMGADKKRSKDERELYNRCKPFSRLMKYDDFENFTAGLQEELNLRQAIEQLQEWRRMQIGDFAAGHKYEQEKTARLQRVASLGFDRFAGSRLNKPAPPVETPSAVTLLTSADLPMQPPNGGLPTPPGSTSSQALPGAPSSSLSSSATDTRKPLANGDANINPNATSSTPIPHRPKFNAAPPSNITPFKFESENAPDLHLLTADEREICSALRIMPKPYIAMKESVLREAHRHGGSLKKKSCREICKIDSTKAGKLFDYWTHSGWIAKA